MNTVNPIALWLVRLTGIVLVVLGLLFWNNRALTLVPVHMAIGLAFVLALWAQAGLSAWAKIGTLPVVVATLSGSVVLALGMTQRTLLPGGAHWIVQTLHLLVGIAAMALANLLAARIRQRRSTPVSSHHRPSATADGSLTAS